MSCLLFINNEHTLIDKLSNVTEVQPMQHQGGVSFDLVLKSEPTYVEITMNYNGNFNIYTKTTRGETEFKDETVETLINFLHIFYVNMVNDENKLLFIISFSIILKFVLHFKLAKFFFNIGKTFL